MTYSCAILESPPPIANSVFAIRVEPSGSAGPKISWTRKFKVKGAGDAEAKTVIDGLCLKASRAS